MNKRTLMKPDKHIYTKPLGLALVFLAVVLSTACGTKIIRGASEKEEIKDASALQEEVMKVTMKQEGPTQAALAFLRLEVQNLF